MLQLTHRRLMTAVVGGFLFAALPVDARAQGPVPQQTPPPAEAPPNAVVKEADQRASEGKHDEALALYQKALASEPKLADAHLGAGRTLDFLGRHPEARRHYSHAIELGSPETRAQTLAAMAISYAFESNATEAAKFYQRLFDERVAAGNPGGAAGTANALARVYLESGDLDNAEKWYRTGYETSKKISGASDTDRDLWLMRWHHAQARIAARRRNIADARRHAETLSEILSKGRNESERPQYHYLLGYIALEAGEYERAIQELEKGNLTDSFVLGLIARAYDKTGNAAQARAYYAKVLASPAHNINSAFARQWALKYLKQSG
jgi:tetratricopeptide (TPR) repeat protein